MTAGLEIVDVETRLYAVPLATVLADAMHGDHTHFELVTATVTLCDGSRGTGYTYTGGRGGRAIRSVIADELAPFVVGRDAVDVEGIARDMEFHLHYVGRGGIAGFGISAVDIALWDLRCRREDVSLARLIAGAPPGVVRAYHGGIDLGFTTEQ